MSRPMHVVDAPTPTVTKMNATWLFVDFGVEIQGGMVLSTKSGTAGQQVRIVIHMLQRKAELRVGLDGPCRLLLLVQKAKLERLAICSRHCKHDQGYETL